MPIVLVTVKHSPENCAMFNAEARKATLAMLAQQEELLKKYDAKMLGGWVVSNEHLVMWVLEVASLDTMEQLLMEPVMVAQRAFNRVEVKIATSMEESAKLLRARSKGITIVYDTKFSYLKEKAEDMETGLKEKGVPPNVIKIKASKDLTEDDVKDKDVILLRSKAISETTKENIDVPSTTDWSKSEGDVEVTKHMPTGSRVFVVGGKTKRFVTRALYKLLEKVFYVT